MAIIAVVFALVLQHYGSSVRRAIVVDGPAENDTFEYRNGRSRLPTLRVPLGGKITYHLPWHVQEGGCERVITRTFRRGEPGVDAYVLTQDELARAYPVGRPGFDTIEVALPDGIKPGLWFYKATGVVQNCPIPRKPEEITYAQFYVEVYDPDGPVSIEIGSPKVLTPRVPVNGKLQYRESFKRTEEIESELLFTFMEVDGKGIVLDRRPGAYTKAGEFLNIDVTAALPPNVHPGKWKMRKTTISTRPGGRTRVDPMFEIEFEVIP